MRTHPRRRALRKEPRGRTPRRRIRPGSDLADQRALLEHLLGALAHSGPSVLGGQDAKATIDAARTPEDLLQEEPGLAPVVLLALLAALPTRDTATIVDRARERLQVTLDPIAVEGLIRQLDPQSSLVAIEAALRGAGWGAFVRSGVPVGGRTSYELVAMATGTHDLPRDVIRTRLYCDRNV